MSRLIRRRLFRPIAAVTLAAWVMMTASCGVSLDARPRTLEQSATSQPRREAPSSGVTTTFLYFVENGRIVASSRDVPDRSPATVLSALFDDLTDEDHATDLISQIPSGTSLRSAVLSDGTLTVDLSKEFDNLVGSARGQAAAQIVFSSTELTGIDEVTFLVDGKSSKVFSPVSGDADRVGACDYLPLLASNDDMRADKLPAAAARRVTALRSSLASRCPASAARNGTAAN